MSEKKGIPNHAYTRLPIYSKDVEDKIKDALDIPYDSIGELVLDGKIVPTISLNASNEFDYIDLNDDDFSDSLAYSYDYIQTDLLVNSTYYLVTEFTLTLADFIKYYARRLVFDFRIYGTVHPNNTNIRLVCNGSTVTEFTCPAMGVDAWSSYAFSLMSAAPEIINSMAYDGDASLHFEVYAMHASLCPTHIHTQSVEIVPHVGASGDDATAVEIIEIPDGYASFQPIYLAILDSATVVDANNTTITLRDIYGNILMTFTGHETSWNYDSSTELQSNFPADGLFIYMDSSAKATRTCCYLDSFVYGGLKGYGNN